MTNREGHSPERAGTAGGRSRRLRRIAGLALLAVVALNVVTFRHAWRSTHFVEDGPVRSSAELSMGAKLWGLAAGVPVRRPANHRDPASIGLEFETVTFTTSDEFVIEAWFVPAEGARDLVVLFHGYSAARESLLGVAGAFHGFGLDVLLVDFRGSGGSQGSVTSIGWYEALDVEAAVDFARSRYRPRRLLLHGVSLGAAAVLRAMGTLGVTPDAILLEGPFPSLLATTARRFQKRGLPAFPAAHLLVFWGGLQLGFDGFAHEPVEHVPSVQCPALLLFGAEDPNVPPADARALLRHAGPLVEHRFLDGAGHPPLFHRHEEAWTREVGVFLRGLSPAPPPRAR